jgi:hypothetical protein
MIRSVRSFTLLAVLVLSTAHGFCNPMGTNPPPKNAAVTLIQLILHILGIS